MKCQFCSKPSTVHLTDIVNKQKRETHLCEDCARERNVIPAPSEGLNVPAVLNLLFGQAANAPARPATVDSVCPKCGTPYAHFRAQGRLGCPHDYAVFRMLLEPLIEKVQCGATRHDGKTPSRQRLARQRVGLEAELRQAVTDERYEEAARLRDALRKLGSDA